MKTITKGNFKVTSPFGMRVLNGKSNYHKGIDIVALDASKQIVSVCDGVVVSSLIITDKKNLTWQWGNYVRVDDALGNQYFYCHLASRAVRAGDKVKAGDVLGVMGATGYTFGDHVHFEARDKFSMTLNPAAILGIENKVAEYSVATKPKLYDVTVEAISKGDKDYFITLCEQLQIKSFKVTERF